MAAKIKTGDIVVLLAGKDKGKQGRVLKVMPKDARLVVEGLNMVQRHTKASQSDPQGGIKSKEATLHVSNVAIADTAGKATRVGFRTEGDKKVRFAKTTGETISGRRPTDGRGRGLHAAPEERVPRPHPRRAARAVRLH